MVGWLSHSIDEAIECVSEVVQTDPLGGGDRDDRGVVEKGALDVLGHVELGQLEEVVVDVVDLGEGDDTMLDAEQVEDPEVFFGLRLPALGGCHDEEAAFDCAASSIR